MKFNEKFMGIFLSLGLFLTFRVSVSAMLSDVNDKGCHSIDSKGKKETDQKVLMSYGVSLTLNKNNNLDKVKYYVNIFFAFKNLLKRCELYYKDNLKDQLINNISRFILSDEEKSVDELNLIFRYEDDVDKFQKEINNNGLGQFKVSEDELLEFKNYIKKYVEADMKNMEESWGVNKERKILEKGENDLIDYYINTRIGRCEDNIESFKKSLNNNNISEKRIKRLERSIKCNSNDIKKLQLLKQKLEKPEFKDNKIVKMKKSAFWKDYNDFKYLIVKNFDMIDDFKIKCDSLFKKIDEIKLEDIVN